MSTWLINSKAIAKKVRNASRSSAYQINDYGANRECPKCHCRIDNSDVSSEWPGLPAGVKFDPSDAQLLEHLAAKCGAGNLSPHMFIDEFIPTLEGEGIYCDHPENLPGAKKDGSSVHFFHRIINAYATGQRKRRKIHNQHSVTAEHVRWHKTGKTKAVVESGIQKGCKKIMVLYKSSKKGSKPDKANWIMHQYHLGAEEDEKEGEYVVSKIFYQQQKQTDKDDKSPLIEDSEIVALHTSPRTPNTNPPIPPRHGKSIFCNDVIDDNKLQASAKEAGPTQGTSHAPQPDIAKDDMGYPEWLAGESQAVESSDINCLDETLLCKEIFDSGLNYMSDADFASGTNDLPKNGNASYGIADLENLELDTPPDFQLSDLQFSSQESILGWLDNFEKKF
ncbi:SUPPRESSOR OF GAMMA RESPONSE 1 isoform X2 [Ziziphus jujuba]|uniref:SUPPRESSOR OF GAMMA RESPONSE 1 isoform X2 n=1 Tax=Ziziphus jujuba TaxID=326968 RepID=A0A6P3ZKC8_ZIZJJ|nr:SUPPRESSOR OF GAMMA RESPONSE 1 isoform X2 [Ziziphus jujuba]